MYTSYIGKKFLKLYKEKENMPENYSAREFFVEVLFPIFFDDDKHLMHVHGSTFFQVVGKNDLKLGQSESNFRLNRLHNDIQNYKISGSTYVGYAAGKIDQPTSGQVSSINYKIESDEIYASWIGEGLSIGVSGGLILDNEDDILWDIFSGWNYYRQYLNQTPNLKGRQIETWNGHWLCHCLSKDYNKNEPLEYFNLSISSNDEEKGFISINTISWIKVLFSLARKYPNEIKTCYAYFLGKTNTTIGFVNLYLPDVKRLYEIRDKLFIDARESILKDKDIEELETFYTFSNACKMGVIGLKAIETRGLREFMPKGTSDYTQGKYYKLEDKSFKTFQLYKLWITAMLNKTELLKLASDVAATLIAHESKDSNENRGKSGKSNQTKEVLESNSLKRFIDSIIILINNENAETFKEMVEQIIKMPSDNFPLFATLIRFEYTYQTKK